MDPSAERPAERRAWHPHSRTDYITTGVVIGVLGTVFGAVAAVLILGGGDSSEVTIPEPESAAVDQPVEAINEDPVKATIEPLADQGHSLPRDTETSAPGPADASASAEQGHSTTSESSTSDPTTSEPPDEGCDRFAVYAQGRLSPSGTAVRTDPSLTAPQTGSIQANVVISVDGWVRTDAPYPDNDPPWNEPVWFRLTDRSGWVSFVGVRSKPSHPGGTDGPEAGGWPVDLNEECEISAPHDDEDEDGTVPNAE